MTTHANSLYGAKIKNSKRGFMGIKCNHKKYRSGKTLLFLRHCDVSLLYNGGSPLRYSLDAD